MPAPIPAPQDSPRRRTTTPLPPYRYVPGLGPHPKKDLGGHSKQAPATSASTPGDTWLFGLDLFDHRYLWEAHEVLEGLWHQLPRGTPERDLVHGVILAAASALKHHMGDERSATRLAERAHEQLSSVGLATAEAWGIDPMRVLQGLDRFRRGGDWPTIS